jgi:HEPN domain-containing protein
MLCSLIKDKLLERVGEPPRTHDLVLVYISIQQAVDRSDMAAQA